MSSISVSARFPRAAMIGMRCVRSHASSLAGSVCRSRHVGCSHGVSRGSWRPGEATLSSQGV
eukprot:6315337-Lingulodinium_polyedra.AAC.1